MNSPPKKRETTKANTALEDAADELSRASNLRWVLVGEDGGIGRFSQCHPSVIEAVDLAYFAGGMGPPLVPFEDVGRNVFSEKDVLSIVAELKERDDIRFVLAWHLHGDEEPRIEHSESMSWEEAWQEMVRGLQGEVELGFSIF